jgi:hypothetical protein
MHDIERWRELNLNASTEELLSAERAFTYADLYALLGNEDTVLWLTPHAAVARASMRLLVCWGQLNNSCRFRISTDDGNHIYAWARSPEHLLDICDVVLRLLAASVVHSVHIHKLDSHGGLLINAPTLAYLMGQCQSLKALSLKSLTLDENQIRVLGAYSRPDLEVELIACKPTSTGTITLAEVLGRNQGPTSLAWCEFDYSVLADGLRGNSRLKILRPPFLQNNNVDEERQVLSIASALRENKGLIELNLHCYGFRGNDETWRTVCDSLQAHPTLEVLNLSQVNCNPSIVPAIITSRMQALLDMMKVNMSINTTMSFSGVQ